MPSPRRRSTLLGTNVDGELEDELRDVIGRIYSTNEMDVHRRGRR